MTKIKDFAISMLSSLHRLQGQVLTTHKSRHTQRVLLKLGLTTAELKLSKVMGPVKSAAARPPHILAQSTDPVPRYPL